MWKKLITLGILGLLWPVAGFLLLLTVGVLLPWGNTKTWVFNSYEAVYLFAFSGTFIFWIIVPLCLWMKKYGRQYWKP